MSGLNVNDLIDLLRKSFRAPYSTTMIISAVSQGVLYLASIPGMPGEEKKKVLIDALDYLLDELGVDNAISDLVPVIVDNLVLLGKAKFPNQKCKLCC